MANEFKIASKLVLLNGNPVQLPTRASDPGSATNGDMYYSSSTNKVRVYQAGAWADLASGSVVLTGAALNENEVIVGNSSNLSAAVDTSAVGDILVDSTGGLSIKAGVIANADINASAAIDASKIADGSVSSTEFQYLDGVTSSIQDQLDDKANDADVIKKDGSVAFTGDQSMGGNQLTNLGAPSASSDAATKGYVDSVAEGLKPKAAVVAATTADITLSGEQTIDGIALVTGDRVLVKDQTDAEDNGIYIVDSSTWSRSPDFDSLTPIDEINGAMVAVQEGTTNAGKVFVQSGVVTTLGTDPIDFIYFNSSASLVGGDGITVSGSNISVDQDGEGLTFVANQLALELDGSTLSKSSSGLKVATGGITNTEVAAGAAIALSKLASLTASRALQSDGSGVISASSVTSTELGYLSGVTSAIQTQLDGKASTALDNLASVAINTALLPASANSIDFGSASFRWKDLYAARVQADDGSAGAPSLSFRLDPDTGIYRPSSDQMYISIGGNDKLRLSSGSLTTLMDIIPSSNDSFDLGSDSVEMAEIWGRKLQHNDASNPTLEIGTAGNNGSVLLATNGTGNVDVDAAKFRRGQDGSTWVEEVYVDSTTLTANTTTTPAALTYALASFEGCEITYKMKQATGLQVRIGTIRVANNGTAVSLSDVYSETADAEITASAAINGANIEISFANANASNNVVMRADVKKFRA